ncbi:kinase-like domain-containing protein [Suillus ampliporus]|nr:kinase-like domain-containing protein [Suillus ampliporus]
MAPSSLISVISWCRSILCFLFLERFPGSDPAAGGKDPNADHDNAPNDAVIEPFRDCRRKHELLEHKSQTAETSAAPGHPNSVNDVLRTVSSSSSPSLVSGMLAQNCTTSSDHEPAERTPKLQRFSKMLRILQFRALPPGVSAISSPQPDWDSNDPKNWSRMDGLLDLTGQLNRTSSYATSFGGLSDIWRCIWNRNGSAVVVAVKSIRSQAVDQEDAKKKSRRLRRELKVWSRLRHDNVVPLYGTVSGFGQFVALVCPWYENGSLSGYLESLGETLSMVKRFQLLSDISAGLQYLHSCSVVHGDLTGSNVLISSDGRAHLSDFGLSVIVVEFVGTSYFTSALSGTVRWTAPELLAIPEEEGAIMIPTSHSDIYSFGCIMFQGLTGKAPYSEFKRDAQVVVAISLGTKPLRPESPVIADHHWGFVLNCWSIKDCRPSAQQVDEYIKGQLHLLQHSASYPD